MLKTLLIVFGLISCVKSKYANVNLNNNRYDGLVIAINPQVPEDANIIQGIKEIWTDTSQDLWRATNNRAYFGDVTILVPQSWKAGSYSSGNGETYNDADVVIAAENPKFGDNPYTVQYGECGQHGEYIHLTPHYVLNDDVIENYGPKGKAMVHEWPHLRWGVFDEYPTEGYDPFYYTNSKQEPEATRCPLGLSGKHIIVDETGEAHDCQYNSRESNWLPEDGCIFIPDKEQHEKLNASMLSHPYRDEVITFCHNDKSDPINLHNDEAPNEHNRLCNRKSVWEVILESEDFFNGKNQPNIPIRNVVPTFKVVQQRSARFVLVLDTSGSMGSGDGSRFDLMKTAASNFIRLYASKGSAVGIVGFSSYTSVLSNIVTIETENDREGLNSKLPAGSGGGTCIGCGINTATDLLQNYDGDASGGHVMVLTDGEENGSPYVREVHEPTKSKGVKVDSLFFGDTVNADLQRLTEETGGMMYVAGVSNLLDLMESFKALSETEDGDVYEKLYQLHGESYSMSAGDYASGLAVLDSTVGKSTVFSFTWSQYSYAPNVILTDPSGIKYCTNRRPTCSDDIVNIETSSKTILFEIPGTAKAGKWIYEISTDTHSEVVNVIVTTMAADQTIPPIVVDSSMSSTDVARGDPIVVNAMVTVGYEPVLDAFVEAQITSVKTGAITTISLYDYGSAPDVRRNDGVYSKYFTDYSGSGRYSVQVRVVGVGNDTNAGTKSSSSRSRAPLNFGYVDSDGTVVLNPNGIGQTTNSGSSGTSAKDIDAFSRIESAGAFSYEGSSSSTPTDAFPPSKVIDLTVKQLDSLDVTKGVQLTFTAPGDDYDTGTAQQYEIRYTYDAPSILTSSFTSANPVENENLLSGDLSNPSIASTVETYLINITDIPTDKDMVTVAFALRATDEAGNTADISNIALMNLFLKPPVITCTDKNGKPISSNPFEKSNDCYKFYQCSNGKLHTIPCESGTVFNPDIGVCDHPANVPSCDGKSVAVAPEPNPTESPQVQATTPAAPPAPPSCKDSSGSPATTAPFPKDGDCSRYYQCSQGRLYELSCPPGLAFNPTGLYCDWPQNVPGC